MRRPFPFRPDSVLQIGERGTAMIEFAMVVPIMLMVIFGIVAFGIYFAGLIAVTHAAAEGARASVAGLSTSERQSLAESAAETTFSTYAPFLDQSHVNVATEADPSDATRYRVSVSYDFSSYDVAGMGAFLGLSMRTPTITVTVANSGTY